MPPRECPFCGEGYANACPYLHQPDLRQSDQPCLDFWSGNYDPDRGRDERLVNDDCEENDDE